MSIYFQTVEINKKNQQIAGTSPSNYNELLVLGCFLAGSILACPCGPWLSVFQALPESRVGHANQVYDVSGHCQLRRGVGYRN